MDGAFAAAKQALLSAKHLAHSRGPSVPGSGCLGDTCGWMPMAAAIFWQEGLAALRLLLKEAGGCPA